MITPIDLQRILQETGYPVTVRRLTDWRSKGLLPPLASQGRGKGLGKIYFWNDPEILVRAQFVHIGFAQGATAKFVMLSLAHGSFKIDAKLARGLWRKHLTRRERLSEKRIEPGESPRDAFWNQGLEIASNVFEENNVPENVIGPLIAEVLGTIYAVRGFRPNGDDLSLLIYSAKQYVTATMVDPRHRRARLVLRRLLSKRKNILQSLALLRSGLSVTATKELLKSTNAEQFNLAISATRLLVRAFEALIETQMQGKSRSEPILEVRLIFRAILGRPITTFFLQLACDGYERKLRKSMLLLEVFIAGCKANSCQLQPVEQWKLPEQLQLVTDRLISEFREIWRDFSLFRLYNIA